MSDEKEKKIKKKKYKKPTITSEELTAYGALCNGTTNGGRKVTVGGVPPTGGCNSSKLQS